MNQEAYNPELFKNLLNAALLDAKRRNGRFMTFFCDEEYEKATMECGFMCVGNNLCQGMTEQLKASDQMAWVGRMNNIRASATEIVNCELIYT